MDYLKFVLWVLILTFLIALGLTHLLNEGVWELKVVLLSIFGGLLVVMNLPGLYVKTSPCAPDDVIIHPQIVEGTAEYHSSSATRRGGYNYLSGSLGLPGGPKSFMSVDCWLPSYVREVMVWHDQKHGWVLAEVIRGKRTGRAWRCNCPATGNKVRVSRGRAFV